MRKNGGKENILGHRKYLKIFISHLSRKIIFTFLFLTGSDKIHFWEGRGREEEEYKPWFMSTKETIELIYQFFK